MKHRMIHSTDLRDRLPTLAAEMGVSLTQTKVDPSHFNAAE